MLLNGLGAIIRFVVAIVHMRRDDPLSDLLSVLRPKAYAFRGLDVGGDWSLRLPAGRIIRCYAVVSGACGLWVEGVAEPRRLAAGDLVLLPHGDAIVLGSRRDAPAIDLHAFFTTVADGEIVSVNGGGSCCGFGGYFGMLDAPTRPLLGSLPPVVHLDAGGDRAELRLSVERLMGELRHPQPGGRLLAEHLCQTLLIEALRLQMASENQAGAGWLTALNDPQLLRAVCAIHADNSRRWTLASLARVAGMSRSSFAARFTAATGEPAIAYMTRWRMLLAVDRLGSGAPTEEIAREFGYGSASAFCAAFRRSTGAAPSRSARPHRRRAGTRTLPDLERVSTR